MISFKKIQSFLDKRSKLDIFLLKASALVIIYYLLRILIKFTPFIRPVFVLSKKILFWILIEGCEALLSLFGYSILTYSNNIEIEGYSGVRIINACLGWSTMALFVGFVFIYPGNKKARYWFILLGLVIIIMMNMFRICGMVLISRYNPEALDFYHQYVFNIFLHLTVFVLWFIWVKKFGYNVRSGA